MTTTITAKRHKSCRRKRKRKRRRRRRRKRKNSYLNATERKKENKD